MAFIPERNDAWYIGRFYSFLMCLSLYRAIRKSGQIDVGKWQSIIFLAVRDETNCVRCIIGFVNIVQQIDLLNSSVKDVVDIRIIWIDRAYSSVQMVAYPRVCHQYKLARIELSSDLILTPYSWQKYVLFHRNCTLKVLPVICSVRLIINKFKNTINCVNQRHIDEPRDNVKKETFTFLECLHHL